MRVNFKFAAISAGTFQQKPARVCSGKTTRSTSKLSFSREMYGGRRPIVAQFPAANNPPTAAICSGGGGSDCGLRQISGAADPSGAVDFDRMINCRVTSVIDPTSFWAQVGEGRRAP